MRKKILSIVLTVTLILSFGLMAVPVAAAEQPTVNASFSADDQFLYMDFTVEEGSESFLLVFMDTKEGGRDDGADYMIVDPFVNDNLYDGWYLGKWLTEEERRDAGATGDVAPGWSETYDYANTLNRPWNAWECEGFVAEESRGEGSTHYEFTILLDCIGFDPDYGLNFLVETGTGRGDWAKASIGATAVVKTEVVEAIIQISIEPTNFNFGQLRQGECSVPQELTITSGSNMDIVVSTSTESDFYSQSLSVGVGDTWTLVNGWSADIAQGGTLNTNLKVCVPDTWDAGIEKGTIIFWAEEDTGA